MKLIKWTAVFVALSLCLSVGVLAKESKTEYASRKTAVDTKTWIVGTTELEDGATYMIYTISPTVAKRKLIGNTIVSNKLATLVKNDFTYPESIVENVSMDGYKWILVMTDEKENKFKLKTLEGKYLYTFTEDKNFGVGLTEDYEKGHTFVIDDKGRLKSEDSGRYLTETTTKDVWFSPLDAQTPKYQVCFYQTLGWYSDSEAVGYSGTVDGKRKDLAAVRFVFDCGLNDEDVERSYIVYTSFDGFGGGDTEPETGETRIVASDNNGLGKFYGDVDDIDFLGTAYALGCVKVDGKFYWSSLKSQEITQLGEVE